MTTNYQIVDKIYNLFSNKKVNEAEQQLQMTTENELYDDNLLLYLCLCDLEFIKWLFELKPSINTTENNEIMFIYSCQNGNFNIAEYIYTNISKKVVIKYEIIEQGFFELCQYGHLEIAKWLFTKAPSLYLSKVFKYCVQESIIEALEYSIYYTNILQRKTTNEVVKNCNYDTLLDVAKWLIEINPDIDIDFDYIYLKCRVYEKTKNTINPVIQFLEKLMNKRNISKN